MKMFKDFKNSKTAHDISVVLKTLAYLVMAFFIGCGVLYITNYEVKIEKRITVVSPI